MENYSIYLEHETEKHTFMNIARAAGAEITDVSGCGTGYHISLLATPAQASRINRKWSAA